MTDYDLAFSGDPMVSLTHAVGNMLPYIAEMTATLKRIAGDLERLADSVEYIAGHS